MFVVASRSSLSVRVMPHAEQNVTPGGLIDLHPGQVSGSAFYFRAIGNLLGGESRSAGRVYCCLENLKISDFMFHRNDGIGQLREKLGH